MNSNKPKPPVSQKAQKPHKIPSKLLRYRVEMEANEVRKRKVIGAKCYYSTLGPTNSSVIVIRKLPKSLKEFKKIRAIKDLHFKSPTRPQFVADPIEKNITKRLEAFSQLEKLKIEYGYSSGIDKKTFKNIVKGVKKMKHLKEFQLGLPPYGRTQDYFSIETLGKSLRRLAQLEKIALNLDSNYFITGNGFSLLTQSFQRLNSLKTLNLSLKRCGTIGDQEMLSLSQHMKKYPALENFSMLFFGNGYIGENGLQYLNEGFNNLTNLKTVKLGFRACDGFSDIGVEKLFNGLYNLERIWINFRGCDRIRDPTPQSLGEKFQKMLFLKKLTIKFRGCDKITDEGVTGLMNGLRAMSANGGCLEDMTLIFTGCKKITAEGLWQIGYALQDISSLKIAQLGFKSCKNLTADVIKKMVGDVKKVNPGLKLTLLADSIQVWQGVCL